MSAEGSWLSALWRNRMNFERFLTAVTVAAVLLALFLVAVREGYLASPGPRRIVVAAIALVALMVWLLPVR